MYLSPTDEKPYVWHKDSFVEQNISAAFVLAGMEGMKYKSGSIMLEPGDMVYVYTDGVTEASNRDNELFGEERLQDALGSCGGNEPGEVLGAVRDAIRDFVDGADQFDDITMLAMKYEGPKAEKD